MSHNHLLNLSTPSPFPGACVPVTAGTHAELLVYLPLFHKSVQLWALNR